MSTSVHFHSQIASIMEVLANAAVAEICKVVDDGYGVVHMEMSQGQKENEFLRRKVKLLEVQIARFRAERVKSSEGSFNNRFHGIRLLNRHNRETTGMAGSTLQNRARLVNKSFGNNIQREREPIDLIHEVSPKPDVAIRDESTEEGEPELVIIKVEGAVGAEDTRSSHPDTVAEGSREHASTAAARDVLATQPRTSRCVTEDKTTVEGERNPQQLKEENLQEMLDDDKDETLTSTLARDAVELQAKNTVMNVHRPDTVLGSEPEPRSVTQSHQHKGPGPVTVNQQPSLHSDRTGPPGTSWNQRGSETETERPSCTGISLPLTRVRHPPVSQKDRGKVCGQGSSEVKPEVIIIDVPDEGEEDTPSPWRQDNDRLTHRRGREGGGGEAATQLGNQNNTHQHLTHVQVAVRQNPPDELFYPMDMNGAFDNSLASFQKAPAPLRAATGEQPYPPWAGVEESAPLAHQGDTANHQDQGPESESRSYMCTTCGKQYPHLCQLKIHQRVHTGEKPYECVQCGKQFGQFGSLKRHQRVHTGEKPFRCTQCGKQFSHASNLKVHQSVHTGEKRFNCNQCGKNFSFLSNLIRHQAVHAREIGPSVL